MSATMKSVIRSQKKNSSCLREQAIRSSTFMIDKEKRDASVSCFFLRSAFDFLSSLCKTAGDFLARKFISDLWPIMSSFIIFHMEEGHQSSPHNIYVQTGKLKQKRKEVNESVERIHIQTDSFDIVIVSILRCIKQTFEDKSLASSLLQVIPSIGNLIIPYLSINNEIGDFAEATVRSLLLHDCSSLLRGLSSICEGKSQLNPFYSRTRETSDMLAANKTTHQTISVSRSRRLIEFIDGSKEQCLK